MPEPGEITMLKAGEEFSTCPACGYRLGFHTSFVSASATRNNPVKSTREVYRVILICPECGARYDVGWRISFSEFESRFIKTPGTPPACVPHGNPAACLPAPLHHDRKPDD